MRLFVAVVPPEPVVEHLDDFLEPRRAAADFRWTRPEHFHVTLAFMPAADELRLEEYVDRLAASLDGLPASRLQTSAYRYTLPVQAAAGTRSYTFAGLPAGTYLMTYDLTADMSAAGANVLCALAPNGTGPLGGASYGGVYTHFSRATSSAVVTTTPAATLLCQASAGTFALVGVSYQHTVSFVPVDTVVDGAATGS